jgi:cytochrome c oxidase subunit 3
MAEQQERNIPLREVGPVAMQFETMAQQAETDVLGMWVFIATEVMMFGAVVMAFVVYRSIYPEAFHIAAGHLHWVIGTGNTAILLTSSLSMGLAEWNVNRGQRRMALLLMSCTVFLGVMFLCLKGYEYDIEFHEGLAPFTGFNFDYTGPFIPQANLFFRFYYTLTGLHALHLSIGIVLVMVAMWLVYGWKKPSRIARQIQIIGIYWAFVDMVWVFVYPLLYMTGHALG